MTDSVRRDWQTPKLMVLERVHAEERVLANCKAPNKAGPSAAPERECYKGASGQKCYEIGAT